MKKSPLTVKEFDSMEQAMLAASTEQTHAQGRLLMMSMFRQGQRYMLSGSFLYELVRDCCTASPAKKGASLQEIANQSANRPEVLGHKESIATYIGENVFGKYTLGAITLNIARPLNFYTIKTSSENRMGFLVIPYGTKIETTDGQHRRAAIEYCLANMPQDEVDDLKRQSIAVVIIIEDDIKQTHQDFADASKTKALPPALLAAFDLRNPANYVVLHLEENCRLFSGLVDATSKSIGKKSKKLFTANQIRQFVKVMLTGNWQQGNAAFDEKAKILFKNMADVQNRLDELLPYLNRLCDKIPALARAVGLPRDNSPESIDALMALRAEKHVCLSASGLVILARIGHELIYRLRLALQARDESWELYADRLGDIDWTCNAEIWQGGLCQPNAKGETSILTHQNLIRQAINKIKDNIGLSDVENRV